MLGRSSLDELRGSSQARSLTFHASQTVFIGLQDHLSDSQNQKKPPDWMASFDLVAGDGLEPTTSGL
jgi:hypothetical protein